MDPDLRALVAAFQMVLDGRDKTDQGLRERAKQVVEYQRKTGVPKASMPQVIRAALLDAGWTDEQIDRAGASPGTVKGILHRPGV